MQLVTPETVGMSAERLQKMTSWMERQVTSNRLAGLSAMIHRRGQCAYFNCTGQMDVEAGKMVAEDTIFRIYSMSKPITAVAAMICYENGDFQLDDPIAKFLPEFAAMQVWDGNAEALNTVPADGYITVRHLLTHTAGFSYEFMEATPVEAYYREHKISFNPGRQSESGNDLATMTTRLAAAPLVRQPGSGWGYSVSIDVLGRLVEVWSGQALDQFFQERIFQPLAMTDTAFSVPADKQSRFAACYEPSSGGGLGGLSSQDAVIRKSEGIGLKLADAPSDSHYLETPDTFSGGGGLVGTIGDYGRFCQMLLNKGALDGVRILGSKTVEFMSVNHLPDNKDMAAMGQPIWSESSAEGIGYISQLMQDTDGAFDIFGGMAGIQFPDSLRAGCVGMIPAADLFDPQVRIYELMRQGTPEAIAQAEEIHRELLPLIVFMMSSVENFIAYGKHLAAQRLGLTNSSARQPSVPVTDFGLKIMSHWASHLGPFPKV